MRVYYAHCIALYGSSQEKRDVETLKILGHEVVNPNDSIVDRACREARNEGHDTESVMTLVFKPMVQACDAFAFRALPGGSIPAGVGKELLWAQEMGKPIVELPSTILGRLQTVEQTREYLRESGYR